MPVYFSPPEEEIIESLREIYGITYLEACEQVIMQKRELAFMHHQRGDFELAKTILKELDEWNDELEEIFQQEITYGSKKKIILLP